MTGARVQRVLGSVGLHAVLVVGVLIAAFPFYYMFALGTQKAADMFHWPPPLGFGQALVHNFKALNGSIPFFHSMWNSTYVAVSHTVLVLLFCSMAGYAFAMYRFPGRQKLFTFLLSTMMIPGFVGIVPWFLMMRKFGWYNNHLALIIPGVASAFGIFWMRQYIGSSVPKDLMDAARIDGCPEWAIFWRVVFPLLSPALGALGIMSFMGSWNSYMGPLLVLSDRTKFTLPVALATMKGNPAQGYDQAVLLLGTALATLPVLLVFLAASRQFMAGMTQGAIKE